MSDRINIEVIRKQLAETEPDDVRECLGVLLEACAEHARELRLKPQEFVELAVEAFAESHDKCVTHFECVEENAGGVQTIVALTSKWTAS